MKKKFIYLIVFIGLIFSSCSSDYDYSTDIDTNEISFVTLTTNEEDKRIFGNEETVTFHHPIGFLKCLRFAINLCFFRLFECLATINTHLCSGVI